MRDQLVVDSLTAEDAKLIADIEQARQPFFTTDAGEERSSQHFAITLLDALCVALSE